MSAFTAITMPDSAARRGYAAGLAWMVGGLALGTALIFGGGRQTSSLSPAIRPLSASVASPVPSSPRTKNIQDVRLGDRVAGRNPIREQVETVTPDPTTWRAIGLRLDNGEGRYMRVELLRSLDWLESVGAEAGQSIWLDMPELGAVGEAVVTHVEPCPRIATGDGAVVTGLFIHPADENSHVVDLCLDGQTKPTGVTSNHPYWSVDRQSFVEAGDLRPGESVDTEAGVRRVASLSPASYGGVLFNLETTEHIYRAGALGVLVHNGCEAYARKVLSRRQAGVVIRMSPLGRHPRTGQLPGYPVSGEYGMGELASGAYHYFHIENGVLRDPAHRRGIPIEEWIRQYNELNGTNMGEILDFFNFLPEL